MLRVINLYIGYYQMNRCHLCILNGSLILKEIRVWHDEINAEIDYTS